MLEQAITLEEIKAYQEDSSWIEKKMISVEKIFEDCPKIVLASKPLEKFLNGVKIQIESEESKIYRIYDKQGKFIGTGNRRENMLKRDVIL